MKTLIALVTFSGIVAASVQPALADIVDRRQAKQAYRIDQGIRRGSLTHYEAARLHRQQSRISRYEWFARRDGYLSRRERARLDALQDRASRNIYAEKHDGQHRGGYRRHTRRWWW